MSNSPTQIHPGQPAGSGYPAQGPAPRRGNGVGVAALVVGIVAIVLGIIPLLGMVAFALGPVAVILGVIGIVLKNRKNGMAITGLILGIAAMAVAGLVTAAVGAGVQAVDDAVNTEHTIKYVVTTSGPANVSYWDGNGSSSKDITTDWTKTVTTDSFSMTSLVVVGDMMEKSASVSCEILIDGKSASKKTGEGTAAMASCAGDTFSDTK